MRPYPPAMRIRLAVLAVSLVPAVASAEVFENRVDECPPRPPGVSALTTSSKVLYVNDCLPNGCAVTRGTTSSITNTSSIASANTTMSAWSHGPEAWAQVIECVKETFAPFDITVVTTNPGTAPHFEVMAGGTSQELNPSIEGAGGIAPSINCSANRNNQLAFVFAGQTSNRQYLCNAIVHEAGHMYGLSHSLDARDPMTYMQLSQPKEWTNAPQTCGTETPQSCSCFSGQQNSFLSLMDTFGLSPTLAQPSIVLSTPKDGMYVKPGFPISGSYESPLEMLTGGMSIDNGTRQAPPNGVFAWNAPTTLAAGPHTVALTATDYANRTVMQTATVTVMASCTSAPCASGFSCLGGICYPGSNVDGGLGASCEGNGDCSTGQCASDGEVSHCTATCDTGNVCPSGYTCLSEANVCWPEEGGGCSTTGSPASLLLGLGALMFVRRRRRR